MYKLRVCKVLSILLVILMVMNLYGNSFWFKNTVGAEAALTEVPVLTVNNITPNSFEISTSDGNTSTTQYQIKVNYSAPSGSEAVIAYVSQTGSLTEAPEWINLTDKKVTATGLLPNVTYSIGAKAKNEEGIETEFSVSLSVTTLISALKNFTAVPSETAITVSWGAVEGATGYDIEVDGIVIDNETNTTYLHTALTPGTQHTYRVRAKNAEGTEEPWSDLLTQFTVVYSPTNVALSKTVTVDSVYTGYTAANAVDGVVSDKSRWVSTNANGPHWLEINLEASCVIGSAEIYTGTGTTYALGSFVLQYWNESEWIDIPGTSVTGNTSTAVTQTFTSLVTTNKVRFYTTVNGYVRLKEIKIYGNSSDTSLPVPTNLSAIATSGATTVTWSEVTGATGYDIEVDGTITNSGNSTTYTHTGLTPGTQHTYRVRAKNAGGAINQWSDLLTKSTELSAPTNVALSKTVTVDSVYPGYAAANAVDGVVSDTSRWVSTNTTGPHWLEINLGASCVIENAEIYTGTGTNYAQSSFVLQYWNGSAWINIPGTSVTGNTSTAVTQTFTSLVTTNKVRFYTTVNGYVRLKEIKIYGNSSDTSLPIPTGLSATVTSNSTTVTWSEVAGATGYDIEVDGTITNSGNSTTYIHTGLTPGTQHTYRVRSKNTGQVGQWSDMLTKSTTTLTNVALYKSVTVDSTYSIYAAANAVDGVVSDTSRWVSANTNGPHWLEIDLGRSYIITGAEVYTGTGSTYALGSFVLQYWNGSEWTDISGTAVSGNTSTAVNQSFPNTVTTSKVRLYTMVNGYVRLKELKIFGVLNGDGQPPAPSNILVSTVSTTSATITWSSVDDVTGYDIEVDGQINDVGINTTYVHSGLMLNTLHTYRIRAKNGAKASEWGAPVSAFTKSEAPTLAISNIAPDTFDMASTDNNSTSTQYQIKVEEPSDFNIAAGCSHTIILMNDGTVKVCGDNYYGQLGLGDKIARKMPTLISGLSGVKQLAAGYNFTLALMNDGTVKAWGSNDHGQLGLGDTNNRTSPITIPDLTGVKQLFGGLNHAVALMNDGTVKVWGYNDYGQLGLGDTDNRTAPITIPDLTGVKQLSGGLNHVLILMDDGTVKAWGWGAMLGLGSISDKNSPMVIPGLTNVLEVSAGCYNSVALINDGTVKTWGWNNNGQLGLGDGANRTSPTMIPGLTGVQQVSAGANHVLAVMNDGRVKSWGVNNNGQLGLGDTSNRNVPASIVGLSGVKRVICTDHSVAVMNDGSVEIWGSGYSGQLGLGDVNNRIIPTTLVGIQDTTPLPQYVESTGDVSTIPGWITLTDKKILVKGLKLNTNYIVTAKAKNGDGIETSLSLPVTGKTLIGIPNTPSNITTKITSTSITITWDAIIDATGYEIEVDEQVVDNSASTTYVHTGLISNSQHTYRVRAKNIYGPSDWSTLLNKFTMVAVPININATVKSNSITIKWDAVIGATEYEVEVDGQVIDNGTSTTYLHSELAYRSTHTYRVRGKNANGEGDWSELIEKTISNRSQTVSCNVDKVFNFIITADNIRSFNTKTFTITYNPDELDVLDLCAATQQIDLVTGNIVGTNITITQFTPGAIVFTVNTVLAPDKLWSGSVDSITFKAKIEGSSDIVYKVEG